MNPEDVAASTASPELKPGQLEMIETYRNVPIYHLEYPNPTRYERSVHEAELRALTALHAPQFGLVINYHNITHCDDHASHVEVLRSDLMRDLKTRLLAAARYHPKSLTSMIRFMITHVYARHGLASGFAASLDSALSSVRRGIDLQLKKATTESLVDFTPTGPKIQGYAPPVAPPAAPPVDLHGRPGGAAKGHGPGARGAGEGEAR